MPLNIKISNFEGPFDLLLHLIKKNEMDIYDIKIYEITSQYLDYINSMKEMDLEVTSEFIVIAATLLEIKSKLLLPKVKADDKDDDENIDPRKELVDKLIEYKKFKAAAEYLKSKEEAVGTVFTKKPEIIDDRLLNSSKNNTDILKDITMLDLYNKFNELMTVFNNKKNTENVIQREIPVDAYRIEDKMDTLKDKLQNNKKAQFSSILTECTSKIEAVVTFLAMLELIKLRYIRVVQEKSFTEIYIERIIEDES